MPVSSPPSASPEASAPPVGSAEVRVRPIRRLSPRTALLVEVAVAVVAVVLAVNLMLAMASDRGGDHPQPQPPGAGPVDTPIPPIGSAVDDFAGDAGSFPGAFPGLDRRWTLEGDMEPDDGVLRAGGPAVAQVRVPQGDKVLQAVVVSPNEGWTVAFSYTDPDRYWAVALGPEFSTLVRVEGGQSEIVARAPITTPRWVEVLVTWRDGQLLVTSGGQRVWSGAQEDGMDVGRIALVAVGATPGGVDSVAVRAPEAGSR